MAKSTRQYVFEGMELIPTALIPFVEKRLETTIKGHWQLEVVQRVSVAYPASGRPERAGLSMLGDRPGGPSACWTDVQ